jgi:hypothetical protein
MLPGGHEVSTRSPHSGQQVSRTQTNDAGVVLRDLTTMRGWELTLLHYLLGPSDAKFFCDYLVGHLLFIVVA